ncbi:MAG: tetratricopeptide repeat protein [Rhodobacteraceae bacterium]|jgi:tetratricopeptide (TPR) repeat protein|uniref:tetratricopeptide repeat protein n=1 Tax=Albidovulum sp. TaxID=1872424 RepID=UPI001D8E5014|nr:tetratricopeptide repeat protein [uncultured Defluviimonas sp.]MCB2124948.1 tetratricopeptide repeat protein [Paracoccaceae bacterium]MCC0070935.1 tetratricopeptide repeat protein [Paracoccaceae bacterium]
MALRRFLTTVTLAAALGLLVACDSAKERAEKHFEAGLEYIQAGDVDRALVEFRNVFQLDSTHREARRAYAEAERGRGRLREAFAQYLRLVEQYPDDHGGQIALAEIGAEAGDWKTAQRYAGEALKRSPGDLALEAIRTAADYAIAAEANDAGAIVESSRRARELLKELPTSLLLHRVVIDDLIRAQDHDQALAAIDTALKLAPKDRALYAQRLSIHAALGDDAAVEAGLIDMVARFDDAPEMGQALVRWYESKGQIDKAEAFLRSRVAPGAPDQEPALQLVRFLSETRGAEAAVAELDRVMAEGATSPVYRAARAGFIFDLGRRDEAIAEMQAILETAEPSQETRRTKVGLARMLAATGNAVGARSLVEEVLKDDGGDAEALKLKANWLILDDQVGEAIAILRRAYDNNPQDAGILTLMAQAYERDGNRDLMRESLSLAVQASNRAPEETLRYAQLLASERKLIPAESVLIEALRIAPGNVSLLMPLGQIYVEMQDWPRAETVAAELEVQADPAARPAAQTLRAAILAGQENTDRAIGYLQGLVTEGKGGLDAKIAILRTHLANGQNAKALAYAASLVAENPDDPDLRFVDGSVRALTGDIAGAEERYRGLLAEDKTRVAAWMALSRAILSDPDRFDDAHAVIDEALAAVPQSGELKWAKAGFLERKGDLDGAIAIYEELYRENSANPVIANNLASLLASHRTDPDSLARAEVIARRLRGSDMPPYQDTYGWIAYQRGNYDDAVKELEKAVQGLGEDPQVRFHLAMTYLKLGREAEALKQFNEALARVEETDSRPFVAAARQEKASLEANGVEVGN